MAPEVLNKSKYTEKADIYSFGLVLWSMVTGQQPFEDINPFAIANEVAKVRRFLFVLFVLFVLVT
jgi:serine/threonine protein kinase